MHFFMKSPAHATHRQIKRAVVMMSVQSSKTLVYEGKLRQVR